MHTHKLESTLRSLKGREVIYFDIRPNGRFEFTGEAFIARVLELDLQKNKAKIMYKMQWGEERIEWVDMEWITTIKQFREEMKLLKKKLQVERKRRRAQKSELHSQKKRGRALHQAVRRVPQENRVRNRNKFSNGHGTKPNNP